VSQKPQAVQGDSAEIVDIRYQAGTGQGSASTDMMVTIENAASSPQREPWKKGA
jgi:hypothetical protein